MQHTDAEYLDAVEEEMEAAVLEAIPPERRLRGLPPEEGTLNFGWMSRRRRGWASVSP